MRPSVPAVYYRGGSSKAVFFHEDDVPEPGPARDTFIKRLMGTPDPIQVDGMGGSRVITSKVALVRTSARPDADVDYTFCQVGITDDTVGYTGNCGNISAAVGPFAIEERLVKSNAPGVTITKGYPTRLVRIYNTGTDKVLRAHVSVDADSGEVVESGDFSIAGVPGTGAAILMDYSQTIGAAYGKGLLPSSCVLDNIEVAGRPVEITICDVANPIIFVAAQDFGLSGSETAEQMNDPAIIAVLKEVRGKGAHLLDRCKDWQEVDNESPFLPMVVTVARDNTGLGHVLSRLILDNRCHDSMAGTGAICTAACSRIPGSVVSKQLPSGACEEKTLKIHHPLGIMQVAVSVQEMKGSFPHFESLSFIRTARRIMTGALNLPPEMADRAREPPSAADATVSTSRPVTREFSDFVHDTTLEDIPIGAIEKIEELLIDHIGVASGAAMHAESSKAFIKATRALDLQGGQSTVYTQGPTFSMPTAALLNAAFAHSFDFDDTFAAGASHPGAALIAAALVQAEALVSTGQDLLVALAVGYEVSVRLARAMGTGGYSRGFHNTSTAGVYGAVAAIAKLRKLPATQIENAFGLAGSRASGSMQFLENGAWNKRLHPGFAAHDAFVCVALAEAGVLGASRSIEGRWGFLNAYSTSPNVDGLTDALRTEWLFTSTALKPFPACRMTHSAIELAASMAAKYEDCPAKLIVRLSPACYAIVGNPTSNKRHPITVVDAQFSIYYQIAVAWLYGAQLGWKAYDSKLMADTKVHQLCERIEVLHDSSVCDLEAQIQLVGHHQTVLETRSLCHPLGEVQNPFSHERVKEKFKSLVVPIIGSEATEKIISAIQNLAQKEITAKDLLGFISTPIADT